jgi:Fe-Mn family superoxide dismutase
MSQLNRRNFIKHSITFGAALTLLPNLGFTENSPSPLKLPPLKYKFDDLAPVIDKETMELHYNLHHGGYLTKLNDALKVAGETRPLNELLSNLDSLPENVRSSIRNNGGGHFNHTLFWESMAVQGKYRPTGPLLEALKKAFGDVENFKSKFVEAGSSHFGSGWVYLISDNEKNLSIKTYPNQDTPLIEKKTPLLGQDLWEHAYYLTYRNRRPEY